MRYCNEPLLLQKVMGLEFLKSMEQVGQARRGALQAVGDQCLLLSGLFPERAPVRRVSLGYFVELGRYAYERCALEHLAKGFVP